MNNIINAANIDFPVFFITLFTLLFGIKEVIEIYHYFKNKFRIKTGAEEDKDVIEKRIEVLEKHDAKQYETIKEISEGISYIKDRLNKRDEEYKELVITQYGAEIYAMHDKFMEQKYVTRAGLETFQKLADSYLAYGGNHLIKQKIIPEVMALEVRGGAYGVND
jgi:uncharacterized coiled-coil protein SlyX